MAERVAVSRIVVGQDKDRKVIQPGQRFETGEYGIDDETLKKWDANRTTREPRDQASDNDTPRARSKRGEVVEGRSGPATEVTNPSPGEHSGEARVLREPTDNRNMLPGQSASQEAQTASQAQAESQTRRTSTRRSDSDL